MSVTLESGEIQLRFDPHRCLFSVEPRQRNAPRIVDAHIALRYRRGRRWRRFEPAGGTASAPAREVHPVHGDLQVRRIQAGPNQDGIVLTLTFALPADGPLLFWSLRIRNGGSAPIRLGKIELLRIGFAPVEAVGSQQSRPSYRRGAYTFPFDSPAPAFFANGWGSWNHTGAYGFAERPRRSRLGPANAAMRVNPGTPQPRGAGHFGSDMFGVLGDRHTRGGLLLGFLSQAAFFGSLEALIVPGTEALALWANGDQTILPPEGEIETDWACLQSVHLDAPDPLQPYLAAAARENGAPGFPDAPLSGWCSWYHYFQDVKAEDVHENLAAAAQLGPEIPLSLIQIDDGWQAQIGDWNRFSRRFPGGPAPLAKEITAAGRTPGLWLAPFIVHPRSALAGAHPEWLLRNRWGLPANAGFVWNTFNRALDISIPAAADYAVESVRRAHAEWGFPYLKLDFLYAGALAGKRADEYRSRARILRDVLARIREAAGPQATLLACGCPLGSAIGLFDAMRINADVAPAWHPKYARLDRFFRPEPDFPAARNALQNALTRAPLHRRWWVNDADCLLLRPESDLTEAEVHTLATVLALTGGPMILSDQLAALPEDRLRIARQVLPPIGRSPHVLDWFDSSAPARMQLDLENAAGVWHLAAIINWDDRPQEMTLDPRDFFLDPGKRYLGREFWTGTRFEVGGAPVSLGVVPAHGCRLLSLRPESARAQYLGSNLHISQGLEVSAWEAGPATVRLGLALPGRRRGVVELLLPEPPANIAAEPVGARRYLVPVDFQDRTMIVID